MKEVSSFKLSIARGRLRLQQFPEDRLVLHDESCSASIGGFARIGGLIGAGAEGRRAVLASTDPRKAQLAERELRRTGFHRLEDHGGTWDGHERRGVFFDARGRAPVPGPRVGLSAAARAPALQPGR
ncbi:hypothetical protein GCM10023089_08870 [Quisquiliibacterium transsilvanicum]